MKVCIRAVMTSECYLNIAVINFGGLYLGCDGGQTGTTVIIIAGETVHVP